MSGPVPEEVKNENPEQENQNNDNFQRNNMRRGGGGGPRGRGRGRGGFRGGGHFNHNDNQNFNRGHFNRNNQNDQDGNENNFQGGGENNQRFPYIDKINEKLAAMSGPTVDLPPIPDTEKKFSGRNRLYIGNISNDATEEDLKQLLSKYGEHAELFVNKEKNFAFVKYDYHASAENAKKELDGLVFRGKNLKARFAPSNATVKVRNLTHFVSNELLHHAFSVFGEIERALVIVDERGKPTGEGIVEFVRKGSALNAIRKCSERCFFLTNSLRPCIVESYDLVSDTDGYAEKSLPKRNPEYQRERQRGPRFADTKSFEHEYGMRWKQLDELYAQKQDALKKELEMEKEKLEAQMEYARYEHETEMLREELRAREMDRERQKQEWEMKERQVEEARRQSDEQIRRREETLQARLIKQEEDMKRRQQENNLFMQAHQLHNMLDEQEQNFEGNQQQPPAFEAPPPRPNFGGGGRNNMGGGGGGRGRWIEDRRDDFVPKRRRF